jgi:hypothetical protein
LTGKDGAFTPLIKQVIEAALEGEMDEHLRETKESTSNRRNGKGRKISKARWAALRFFLPATGMVVSRPKLLLSVSGFFPVIWMRKFTVVV